MKLFTTQSTFQLIFQNKFEVSKHNLKFVYFVKLGRKLKENRPYKLKLNLVILAEVW